MAEILSIQPGASFREANVKAAECLSAGGLVVFPTETVYGVAACATVPAALQRLRNVKERTESKPFTLHIGSRGLVDRFVPGLTGVGRRLTLKAWPGPLTVVFPVPDPMQAKIIQETSTEHVAAMYHDGTIGIRCPDDAIAADLLNAVDKPIVAASANPAGAPAAVEGEQAIRWLDSKVDLIIDAGRTRYGKSSTIVRVNEAGCTILRQGVLDERTIRRLTRVNFMLVCTGNTCRSPMAEILLRWLLAERLGCAQAKLPDYGYHVESAGLATRAGLPPSTPVVGAMKAWGLDQEAAAHRSSPLRLEAINRADYIFTMTDDHRRAIVEMVPSAADRCRPLADEDIEDPIGGDEALYIQCAKQIEQALRRRLEEIPL